MPESFKVLGQAAPAATTEVDIYTVAAATAAVVSSVVVCNRGADIALFRIYVAVGGVATENKQYLAYDVDIDPNDTKVFTIGITLAATDVVRVYASTADLSFNLFGSEVT